MHAQPRQDVAELRQRRDELPDRRARHACSAAAACTAGTNSTGAGGSTPGLVARGLVAGLQVAEARGDGGEHVGDVRVAQLLFLLGLGFD